MYPGVDVGSAQGRFLKHYRALNNVIAVLGLLLLGWLFDYMRRPDWDDGPVEVLLTIHFIVAQMLPLALIGWLGVKFNTKYKRPLPQGRRTAVLQRRGLFDFVSPFVVLLAVVCYFLFAGFVLYLREHPFPGFAGLVNLAGVTLVYAVQATIIYVMLYGKNWNPLDTHEGRLRTIGLAVRCNVYSCIIIVAYLSLNLALTKAELQRWEPFAMSVFFVIIALVASMGYAVPPRQPRADEMAATRG
jgi:MFS family permease